LTRVSAVANQDSKCDESKMINGNARWVGVGGAKATTMEGDNSPPWQVVQK